MENYILKFKNYKKKIVYFFNKGDGGIGDFLKYFMYLLEYSIKNEVQLYYYKGNNAINDYLKLIHNKMYINMHEISSPIDIKNMNFDTKLEEDKIYTAKPYCMYSLCGKLGSDALDFWRTLNIPISNVFYFDEKIKENVEKHLNINDYISIHLRLGDKFLDTDSRFVLCKHDQRSFDSNKLFEFIENNKTKQIFFFCDSTKFKVNLKKKFDFINILPYDICHTSLPNVNNNQILNTMSDFYILTNSQHIYYCSNSGFPIVAAKFNKIPYSKI